MFNVEGYADDRGWLAGIRVNGIEATRDRDLAGVRTKYTIFIDGKEYIIKLGMQSSAEWYFLNNVVEDEDKRYFMPSVAGGTAKIEGGRGDGEIKYILQEFVKFDEGKELHLSVWPEVEAIIRKYKLNDLDQLSDWGKGNEGRNWGIVEGQPVIYDWGLGEHYNYLNDIGQL